MAFRLRHAGVPALLLLGLAACTQDPFDRPGTWRSTGANDRNLRAMVAAPAELNRGVAATSVRGDAGANAATRLLTERQRPLPLARSSSIGAPPQQDAIAPLPGLGIAPSGTGAGSAR